MNRRDQMKVLFIGGAGTISMAITKLLAEKGHEVYLLNRGSRKTEVPSSVKTINADINDETLVRQKLEGMRFDSVCDFIGFVPSQLERDFRIFNGKTRHVPWSLTTPS